MRSRIRFGIFALPAIALMTAIGCGGGGKSTPPAPATYTIGGTITGLTGPGLVLQDNGGNSLTVSANASSFTFSTAITSGGAYSVTVLTQPGGENCTVTSGSGTASANVTSVSVACQQAYTIGGQVFGLTGTGLVLQDNSGNNLTVSSGSSGYAFVFAGAIPSGGAPYVITVLTNPTGQACTVANPIGTATANVTNANVTCTNTAATVYTIGGTVTGLTGSGLILQNSVGINDSDLLPVSGNGNFTFVDPVASGSAYMVSVLTQPPSRNCVLSNGTGTATANVTDVSVVCVGDWTWVGGSSTVGSNFGQSGVYGTVGTAAAANMPGGREQSLSWTDGSGNQWLFGGYGNDSAGAGGLENDLWKFDPKQSEWTWMGGSNINPPSPSFGAAGSPGVYGTLGTASATNVPGGREQVVSWTDAAGNLWLFGGEGNDMYGNTGELNDLWKFDPKLGTTGEWTWMGGGTAVPNLFGGPSGVYGTPGTASPTNVPGGRYGAISWMDATGKLWLFGGDGVDATGAFGYLNDLWMFDPTLGTTGEWTWMSGPNTIGNNGAQPGVYGTLGTASATNIPGGRDAGMSWVDKAGNVWLFGGLGADANGTQGYLNDLWKYTPSTTPGMVGEWTWMGGSSTLSAAYSGAPGVPGTLGTAAAANVPGGRFSATPWIDASGNLWLFGGQGYDSTGAQGYLSDLWEFDPALGATGEWRWMGGSTVVGRSGGQSGVYGTLGTTASTSDPGGRLGAVSWVDSSGNVWMFGGQGYDSTGAQGYLNDLWGYQP